ncbi:MFS transporter [Varunaivibrio sulfuroxidans]|uniref:Transmembrane secretion effector n=1 Tax=Varunaivibrio sulfuroxidans TaxID=1773489 RepID=A0A4R3JJU6_9PROT|nr:MFS transporter [Varunaivibrio sulfuroxidans]TCS65170.1 transmembrane secretion effector [Varunaivibrio sulfuroxidans]WES29548.1 MFS transporter [Varunaivibrio sulfuroxidans]
MLALLKSRRFFPFFAAQFLGAANDNFYKNALVILIAYRLGGENAALLVTIAAGLFILPFFLFSASAGQLADRLDKARLVRLVKALEIAVMTLGAVGFLWRQEGVLLGVLFLMGAQSSLFGPVKYAILPAIVADRDLIGANALTEGGTFLAILLGTIAGGLLVLTPGGEVIVACTVVVLAIAGWIAALYVDDVAPADPNVRINPNIVNETAAIMRHARANTAIYPSMLAISWFWLLGATFLAQFPNFAKGPLHADEQAVTLMLALFTVGVAVGSGLCAHVLKGRISLKIVPWSVFLMSVFIIDLYFATPKGVDAPGPIMGLGDLIAKPWVWRVMADLMMIAVTGGFYIVPLYATIQKRSDPRHRARNIAALNVLNALFMVASAAIAAAMLAQGIGVVGIFLAVGLANLGAGLWTVKMARAAPPA